jgi:membrane fusion protein (multidrug efflux system)
MNEHRAAEGALPPAGPDGRPHWMRRGIVFAMLVLGLLAGVLFLRRSDRAPKAEGHTAPPQSPLEVDVVTLATRTVAAAPRFLGQTEASQVVEIRSRVKGFLLERAFEEGQRVEKDQVLFHIDPRPFEIELASAKASLASAEARRAQAAQQLARYQELFARGSVAQGELEDWQTAERVAAAQHEEEAAHVAKAELDLGYTTITAPIAGVIGKAMKDVGTYVDDAQESLLAVLSQVDPIYVRYAVSEQETLRWQRLQREGLIEMPAVEKLDLALTLGDGTAHPEVGHINFVDVAVDPATGTTVVRGTVPNPANGLKPGQFVHVTVRGIDRVNALVVPQRAVLQSPSGPTVYVVGDDGVVEQRHVTLAEWLEDAWIVEGGLAAGERVVTDRLLQLRPGMSVVASAAAAPAAGTGAQGR